MENEHDIEYNKQLISQYPFLQFRNYQGELVENYDYTFLDDLPEGWKKAFGILICEDIKQALIDNNININDYQIEQVKEKFGGLRWYGTHENILYDIIHKYEHISQYICLKCGKINAQKYTFHGWLSTYCEDCAKSILNNYQQHGDLLDVSLDSIKIAQQNDINTLKYISYSEGKSKECIVNCADIVQRIKENLEKNHD